MQTQKLIEYLIRYRQVDKLLKHSRARLKLKKMPVHSETVLSFSFQNSFESIRSETLFQFCFDKTYFNIQPLAAKTKPANHFLHSH